MAGEVRYTPEEVDADGLTATYNSGLLTTSTYKVRNNAGAIALHFKKSGAGAATITFTNNKTEDGLTIAAQTLTVPATTGDVLIRLDTRRSLYNDAEGDVAFESNDVLGLTVAVLKFPS